MTKKIDFCNSLALRLVLLTAAVASSAAARAVEDGTRPPSVRQFDSIVLSESFDSVVAPALPSGWRTFQESDVPENVWFTIAAGAASSPNAAFAADTDHLVKKTLETPTFTIDGPALLKFRHKVDLDASPGTAVTFDGVVLEISSHGGDDPFQDIFAAGGSFVSGGYDHVVQPLSANPLAGRNAWGGSSGGYVDVVVRLPPVSRVGGAFIVRWQMGTDQFPGGAGYWLDDVRIDDAGDFIFCGFFDPSGELCS